MLTRNSAFYAHANLGYKSDIPFQLLCIASRSFVIIDNKGQKIIIMTITIIIIITWGTFVYST